MTARRISSYSADIELSVSRINRLLRPLRNKCAILASATSRPAGSAAPITYGSGSSQLLEARAPPPLEMLRDPKLVISRAHQESRSLDAVARQIHAITNAYCNVMQASLPVGLNGSRRNVLALTDICAASIGRGLKAEVVQCLAALEGELDEAKETALVDELYESIPGRFRSWTLIAHATSEIVDTCPSHPMLLLNILGVALTHGLYTESKTFLRLFLTTLLRPPRHGVPPPIAHPMHPSYLVELCNEWIRLAPKPCAGPFTYRSFAAVTLEVLVEHGTATTWTCKSITRLVQLLRTRDFGCFLTFLHGLIEFLAARPRYLVHGCEDEYSLLARLAKWTGVITSDFFSVGDAERCGGAAPAHTHAQHLYSIVEILASAHDAALHLSAIDNDSDDDRDARDPQAALVCTATHCLSAPLFATLSAPHRDAVLALLRDVAPSPATYCTLAAQPLASLHALAWALRAHDLCELEQTLWTSAVEHASGADPALRAALVDAAERGRRAIVPTGLGQMRTRRTASARSPPRKRARREAASWQWRRSRSPSSTSTSGSGASTPSLLSAGPSSSSSSSSLSSARSRSRSPVPEDMDGAPGSDGETARRSRSTRRSCADLKSVLADALKTRKDLKAERRRASLRNVRSFGRSMSSERGYSSKEEAAAPALPSEGDVLDMFAYDDPF